MTIETNYDYIIVGGGSAGCALANRLSADPSTRVLVLEANRTDSLWDVFIHMPAALPFPIGSRLYDWKYESEPEPYMNDRRIYHPTGPHCHRCGLQTLGASSPSGRRFTRRLNAHQASTTAQEMNEFVFAVFLQRLLINQVVTGLTGKSLEVPH